MRSFLAAITLGALLSGGAMAFGQGFPTVLDCPSPCTGTINCQRGEIACCDPNPGGTPTCYCTTDPNCT